MAAAKAKPLSADDKAKIIGMFKRGWKDETILKRVSATARQIAYLRRQWEKGK